MEQIEQTPPKKTETGSLNISHPTYYINRELSFIDFQRRVFEQASDPRNPILERIRFLAFVGVNLDEFFMVRVGGLKMQNDAGITRLSLDGLTPAEQLAEIRKSAAQLMDEASSLLLEELLPELAENGVEVLNYSDLSNKQKENANEFFDEVVFPVLTPLAFDPGHPFPHISNLSLNLAVSILDNNGLSHFARVKVPATLPRFVPLKRSSGGVRKDGTVPHKHYFVWLEQLIIANIHRLFPGMEIVSAFPFRVTRNADVVIQELEASDLIQTMEESMRQRRFADVVRLTHSHAMPDEMVELLVHNLGADPNDVYSLEEPLGLSSLMELTRIDRYELKYKAFLPQMPPQFPEDPADGSIFAAIRQQDILVHHPYESFDAVINFLRSAARDPDVLVIKQTLYRVGQNSPVVSALLDARRNGKQVAVLVELKARFDEESNIEWARLLESEGVHVTYGLLGLKTHAKVILVVRQEGDHIRRYVHIGTGNYNHITAKGFEDIGIFTADPLVGADATDLFNYLTGYSNHKRYRKLLVAPINLRSRLEKMILQEIDHHKTHGNGHLLFKMNALIDKPMIKLLYKASQAGVKVDLLVRGMCCLIPGKERLSENIRVISVVGRFLEHSRIYYFHNNGKPQMYLGSADLMPRNLNDRVEVILPVEDPNIVKHLYSRILEIYLQEDARVWQMGSGGTYDRQNGDVEAGVDVQGWLLKNRD